MPESPSHSLVDRASHHPTPHSPAHTLDRALVWFRRDLRASDHTALAEALRQAKQVWCAFVFDTEILDALPRADRRVDYIHASLAELDAALQTQGGGLIVRHGPASTELPALARHLGVQAVFTNRDYEPAATRRDALVRGHLADQGIALYSFKDQVVFETDEVLTGAGSPFSIFTPYKNAWLRKLEAHRDLGEHRVAPEPGQLSAPPPEDLARYANHGLPSLADLDFLPTDLRQFLAPGVSGAEQRLADFLDRLDDYAARRDFPAVKGPSYLSVDLRFGSLSVRRLARLAHERFMAGSRGAEVWLSELIWREFYMQILHHHPRVESHSFKAEYDAIRWEHGKHADELFTAWCEGRTGYPLVDAAMLQLLHSGYMHNRLRMVSASFLVKDLGIDWRRGERWFAEKLNDFDLAANNGGWQWAASTGCDAQPYFRIFNPVTQSEKFDPEGKFIRRYLPQLAGLGNKSIHAPWLAKPLELQAAGLELGRDYPSPVVEHDVARTRTLDRYAVVRRNR